MTRDLSSSKKNFYCQNASTQNAVRTKILRKNTKLKTPFLILFHLIPFDLMLAVNIFNLLMSSHLIAQCKCKCRHRIGVISSQMIWLQFEMRLVVCGQSVCIHILQCTRWKLFAYLFLSVCLFLIYGAELCGVRAIYSYRALKTIEQFAIRGLLWKSFHSQWFCGLRKP